MNRIIEFAFGLGILAVCVSDMWKAFLILTRDDRPLFFLPRVVFYLMRALPGAALQKQYDKAVSVYMRRRKMYAVIYLVGGVCGILLALVILSNA